MHLATQAGQAVPPGHLATTFTCCTMNFENGTLKAPLRYRPLKSNFHQPAVNLSSMDRNECNEIEDLVERKHWVFRYTKIRDTKLCAWVSTFHPQNLTCQIVGSDKRGAYNIVCKVRFDGTGEAWAVRFPQGSKNHSIWDEKFEAEVATINAVRSQTDIPIPEIKAWGLARDNELGLGPFMMSAWVDGTKLNEILKPENTSQERMVHENITDTTIERLWRQIARFMLQLSRINFDHIGSCTAVRRRPLTIKSHHILESGVDISCKFIAITLFTNAQAPIQALPTPPSHHLSTTSRPSLTTIYDNYMSSSIPLMMKKMQDRNSSTGTSFENLCLVSFSLITALSSSSPTTSAQ